jgi:hypothetical protein
MKGRTAYERSQRRDDMLLDFGYVLVVLAALIGSMSFMLSIFPHHRSLSLGLTVAAWLAIFFVVDGRSNRRDTEMRRLEADAYTRGRLEAQIDEN